MESKTDNTMKTRAQLRRQYTRLKHWRNWPHDGYACYLQIGCQSFPVVDFVTKGRAEWFRTQLAAALETLLKNETK